MQGKKTPPEKIEQVVATVARTDSKAETGRVLGMPRETVRDIVSRMTEPEVAEIRRLANNEYVLKTWENILTIETALANKLANNPSIERLDLTELTRALKDLKQTVENVINNIHIGDNIQVIVPTHEMKKETVLEYIFKSFSDEEKSQLKEKL